MTALLFALLLAQVQPSGSVAPDRDDLPVFSGAIRYAEPEDVEVLPHALDAGWGDETMCEGLQETEQLLVFRCTFAPGKGHDRHFHRPHVGYVVAGGTMRITDVTGVREQTIPAGSSWSSDGIGWHQVVNIGDTTTSYVIVEPKGVWK